MTWQNPPPAGPEQATTQYSYPPQGQYQSAPPPVRPAALRWVIGAIVLAVLLVGAFVLNRAVLSRFFGGAGSPEEAVTQAIEAIDTGDLDRLARLLPPDEVAGFSDIQQQADRILTGIGDPVDFGKLTDILEVSVSNLELKTDAEQHALTKVSIEKADIEATFKPSNLNDVLKDRAEERGMEEETASIEVRGEEVTRNGDTDTFRVGGEEQTPFVMTVQRGGSWYVSPLFTAMQYTSEQEDFATSPIADTPGFASPVDAAEGFVSALAESINTRDVTPVAEATGGVEGKLMQTYRDFFNSGFAELGDDDVSVDVTESRFSQLSIDGNLARVRPERLSVTATADGETAEFDWDGNCVEVDAPEEQSEFCVDDPDVVGPFIPLVGELNYYVAVRTDGGWKISATRTYLDQIATVLGWVGDKELSIIKAAINNDITELPDGSDAAATVGIGDTETVEVEALGPYIDGGYTIVDIPNPDGEEFRAYCDTGKWSCNVVLVTPSGTTDWNNSGDEEGTYKGIVIARAGDVEVTVELD